MESGVPHIVQQEKVADIIVSSSTPGANMMPVFPAAPIEVSPFSGAFTLSAHSFLLRSRRLSIIASKCSSDAVMSAATRKTLKVVCGSLRFFVVTILAPFRKDDESVLAESHSARDLPLRDSPNSSADPALEKSMGTGDSHAIVADRHDALIRVDLSEFRAVFAIDTFANDALTGFSHFDLRVLL